MLIYKALWNIGYKRLQKVTKNCNFFCNHTKKAPFRALLIVYFF